MALTACSTTKTQYVPVPAERLAIRKQTAPRDLKLNDPKFYVVSEKNFADFKKRYLENNKEFIFYVVSPADYKKLLVNQAELKRYISQQKSIIVYYESVTDAK